MKVDYWDIFVCGLLLVVADTATGAGLAIIAYVTGCVSINLLTRRAS